MGIHDQPITLVASPSYPNSIAWSKENLVAIATGHLITILNPASPVRPRGLIKIPPIKPFGIGVIEKEDLLNTCILPLSLSRDVGPCARSISWSYPGFAPNSGCLLAVCTTEGRVKLYRPPFCDFSCEWIEVVDISDRLYNYLKEDNFRELKDPSATCLQEQVNAGCTEKSDNPVLRKKRKILPTKKAISRCSNLKQALSTKNSVGQQPGRTENDSPLLITPQQYASRSALMSAIIVAWSPTLKSYAVNHFNFTKNCSILAVGGKSGNISFWRIYEPQCYTIEHGSVPVDPEQIGLLQAHSSWITAISWAVNSVSSSKSLLILATGCCDGSVKIWLRDVEELITTSEVDNAPFSLLREVAGTTAAPVSTISLDMSVPSLDKVVIAIGRGSGSFEVWICHISCRKLQTAGVYNAHNQVVTGLAWAFDGCLYSCSQDNSVRSWVLHQSALHETAFPSNLPGHKNLNNISQVSDLCFGLALSPGGLMVAVVRSFDSELLNQMYQARTQKAAVEFYWNGGQSLVISSVQSLVISSDKHLEGGTESSSCLSESDLVCWESSILQYLEHYENGDEPLVLWDFLMAMHDLNHIAPSFVESVLLKWMSSWFTDHHQSDNFCENVLIHIQDMLPKISTRKMHLINIICRKLMLGEVKLIIQQEELNNVGGLDGEGKHDLWMNLLVNSDRELQERFVSFSFRAVLGRACASGSITLPAIDRNWCPVGVAQMERWVDRNTTLVHDRLKFLRSEIGKLGDRIYSICEYTSEESCSNCSASVPFESVGVAKCTGITSQNGSREIHELKRCAVSMQLLSVTSPMWYCMCCQRWAANLPPSSFFNLSRSPLDENYERESFDGSEELTRALCIFCGILLQRHLPNFFLSASPV